MGALTIVECFDVVEDLCACVGAGVEAIVFGRENGLRRERVLRDSTVAIAGMEKMRERWDVKPISTARGTPQSEIAVV